MDPITNKDDDPVSASHWNLYAFCRNNPLKYMDPQGRAEESVIIHLFLTICLMVICFLSLLSGQDPKKWEARIYINPIGWNIPDPKMLALKREEMIRLPGIDTEILQEWWGVKEGPVYRLSNPSFPDPTYYEKHGPSTSERVSELVIYKTPAGQILFYEYRRLIEVPPPTKESFQLHYGMVYSFFYDLDDDERYETELSCSVFDEEIKARWLSSITRVKLGLSEESELVRSLVRAAVKQISEGQPGPIKKK